MAFGRLYPYYFSCRNFPPSSISPPSGPVLSYNPTLGLALLLTPALASVIVLAPPLIPSDKFFKQFMKAYLETNQESRSPLLKRKRPFKDKVLEMHYDKLYQEFFLPGSSESGWIRSTDSVDCISLSPDRTWSMSINLSYFDYSVYPDLSDHLTLYRIYLVIIGWPSWFG